MTAGGVPTFHKHFTWLRRISDTDKRKGRTVVFFFMFFIYLLVRTVMVLLPSTSSSSKQVRQQPRTSPEFYNKVQDVSIDSIYYRFLFINRTSPEFDNKVQDLFIDSIYL